MKKNHRRHQRGNKSTHNKLSVSQVLTSSHLIRISASIISQGDQEPTSKLLTPINLLPKTLESPSVLEWPCPKGKWLSDEGRIVENSNGGSQATFSWESVPCLCRFPLSHPSSLGQRTSEKLFSVDLVFMRIGRNLDQIFLMKSLTCVYCVY